MILKLLKNKKKRQLLFALSGVYLTILANYILHFFGAKSLSLTDYGRLSIALSYLAILIMIGQLGLSHAIVKFIGKYQSTNEPKLEKGVIVAGGITITIVSVIFTVVSSTAFHFLYKSGIKLLDFEILIKANYSLIPITLTLYIQNIARSYHYMLLASYPSGVLLPLLSVLSFYLAKNQFEFLTLYIYVAYSLLLFTICSILLKEEIRSLFKVKPKFLMKEWTQSSGKILFSVSLNQVLLRGNVLFLSSILPADQIGVYSLSARIAQAITIANRAFNRYWAVLFSKHYNNNDIQRLNRESQKSALVSFGMSALFALILLIWGRNILSIFGPDFISSYTVMLMIVLGYLTISFFSPSITLLQMCNQEQAVNRIYVISVIIMLVGLSISAPVYGTFGAACVLTSVLIHNAIHSAIICICKLKCRADPFLTN